jgi:hypothetical protein
MAATPEVRIVSPKDGTVVAPGATLQVVVEATPRAFQNVLVVGKPIGFSDPVLEPPYRFDVTISPDTAAGNATVEALGVIRPGTFVESPSLTIDVERPGSPESLRVQLDRVAFDHVGDEFNLNFAGKFADGSGTDLTHSTRTRYRSANRSVASVDASGLVIARGVGSTTITIQHQDKSATVYITVKQR